MTYEQLDAIADSVNPVLAVLTLLIPWVIVSSPIRRRAPFYIAMALSMAAMYFLAWIDNTLRLWPTFGLDYSGHTGFATVLLTSAVLWNRRFLIPASATLIAYAGLMIYQKYHSVADILTTLVAIVPLTITIHVAAKRSIGRQHLTTARQQ